MDQLGPGRPSRVARLPAWDLGRGRLRGGSRGRVGGGAEDEEAVLFGVHETQS